MASPPFDGSPTFAPGAVVELRRAGAQIGGRHATDRSTIERLYARHGAMVLRRARAILGDEAAAKDALQEVFVRVIRGWASFRGESSEVTWLYRVTTNLCLNRLRDAARQRELLAEWSASAAQSAPSLEDEFAAADLLRRLPEDLREIGVYYWIDRMSQDEIAEVAGVSRRTIGYRLEALRAAAERLVGAKEKA